MASSKDGCRRRWLLPRPNDHRQFNHWTKRGVVTVPGKPDDDLAPGTLNSILKGGGSEMKYLIVIEPTGTGFSAYSPDLPGCVSTGASREECERNMREAIAFHLDGLREEGEPVPPPATFAAFVDVA